MPEYQCIVDPLNKPGVYSYCTQEEICDGTYEDWQINWDSYRSLHNWVEQMDLHCTDDFTIGWLGSSFFVGCFVGSFILPRIADIKGRKPMFLTGMAIYIGVVIATLFCTNVYFMMIILAMGGISETGRYYVAYVYCIEMMPQNYQSKTGMLIFIIQGFSMTFMA